MVLGLAHHALMIGLAWAFDVAGLGALPKKNPNSAHRSLYRMPLTRLGDFCLGIFASLIYKNQDWSSERSKRVWSLATTSTFFGNLVMMSVADQLFSVYSWDFSFAVGAFFIILGLAYAPQTFLARFLATRWMVTLGEASFALSPDLFSMDGHVENPRVYSIGSVDCYPAMDYFCPGHYYVFNRFVSVY